jgi:hypothetical protein
MQRRGDNFLKNQRGGGFKKKKDGGNTEEKDSRKSRKQNWPDTEQNWGGKK